MGRVVTAGMNTTLAKRSQGACHGDRGVPANGAIMPVRVRLPTCEGNVSARPEIFTALPGLQGYTSGIAFCGSPWHPCKTGRSFRIVRRQMQERAQMCEMVLHDVRIR